MISLLARRRAIIQKQASASGLDHLSWVEISMLTVDGTDGKGGHFDLVAYDADNVPVGGVSFTSSDPSKATATNLGNGSCRVTPISKGEAELGADVTITAIKNGVTRSCLFTIYETLPNADALYTIKGGVGSSTAVYFRNYVIPSTPLRELYYYSDFKVNIQNTDVVGYPPFRQNSMDGGAYKFFVFLSDWSLGWRSGTVIAGEYHYQRYKISAAALLPGVERRLSVKFVKNDGAIVDGLPAIIEFDRSASETAHTNSVMVFEKHLTKVTAAYVRPEYDDLDDLENPLTATRAYIAQNYGRRPDGEQTNPTVIFNMGTLGSAYDLESQTSVPAEWFGV